LSTHQPTQRAQPVRLVLVGGIDPGCGAGVLRDLLTASARQADAILIGTAWTEQAQVRKVEPRDPDAVAAALSSALARARPPGSAVKIGMVATAATARAILGPLSSYDGPVVFDPVLVASSGLALYEGDRESVLALARTTSLLTPNLHEAGWLLNRRLTSLDEARQAARDLRNLGVPAVLVKGGHLEGDATDTLISACGETMLSAARIAGPNPRGTGCTLATAIAAELAAGTPLENAVTHAKSWLVTRIERAAAFDGEWHL
jgi:hydroxymethylpyrimidine/phosphomethylpyrimidine kinase